jgi:hypothetical protein
MMKQKIIPAILILALASLACSFSFNLPSTVEPGPDVTESISVDAPASSPARLGIQFGAGELVLAPGAGAKLVDGTATYNFDTLKPEVVKDGAGVMVKQVYKLQNVPTLKVKNIWDLKLGSAPMDLTVEAGAYKGQMELGGLALTSLSVKDGAADNQLSFSEPNTEEMSMLRYETGASNIQIDGLANANFNTLVFQGGAGNYDLDFSGTLKRDATASITCGLGDLTLRFPAGMHVILTLEGGLHNVNLSSGWSQSGDVYTQEGSGPTLTLMVDMSAGNLTITD